MYNRLWITILKEVSMNKKPTNKTKNSGSLSKERVILAAIKLADSGGIDAMSMRKLGSSLGVEAMAIYYHFADKSQLIEAMIDRIHGEIEMPIEETDWKVAMRSRAESAFEVLLLHTWASPIMEAGVNPGPSTLRDSDNCMKTFRDAGFSIAMTVHAVTVLNIYIYGAAQQYSKLNFSNPEEAAEFSETIKNQFPV
ncbi:MAG: TetR/AcrR family transcriptional regulator C-terminal domain-containing protein, partial [Candidatus Saccharibacteria bacterium]|nr:TetR/AcrR family transcriptional regulator C-terminal domain-containing protein [Candidatus Saccharibacteria bacterium]